MIQLRVRRLLVPVSLLLLAACSSSSETPAPQSAAPAPSGTGATTPPAAKTDADYKAEAVQKIHDLYAGDLADLVTNAKALQAAAPTPAGRGWDPTQDAAAITAMRDAWRKCRIAYEHIEGAVAPLLPDIDSAIDARYDDFLAELGDKGDEDLFDDQGVTGMHAAERIIFANDIPARAVDFEKTLPGYKPAAFPATADEAARFKTKLLQRLVDDVTTLEKQWQPAKIDAGVAFQGLVSLMNEQGEKVTKAATGEEESRYGQMTLFDLRNNLEGTRKAYEAFQPWLVARASTDPTKDGKAFDQAILSGFDTLSKLYGSYSGDAVPAPPATWSSLNPTTADLETPFGKLYLAVTKAVDTEAKDSVVSAMNGAATVFGFPLYKAGE